jgi:hypothetical protein
MSQQPDDAQRAQTRRTALIIGGVFGTVFIALMIAALVKNGGIGGAVEVRTGAEWKQVPDSKRVQVRGRLVSARADGPFTTARIVMHDGTEVLCVFDLGFGPKAPRGVYSNSDLADWAQSTPPGAEIVVVGRGSRNPPTVFDCDTMPPIPRVR